MTVDILPYLVRLIGAIERGHGKLPIAALVFSDMQRVIVRRD
jgi:hypothetical protein